MCSIFGEIICSLMHINRCWIIITCYFLVCSLLLKGILQWACWVRGDYWELQMSMSPRFHGATLWWRCCRINPSLNIWSSLCALCNEVTIFTFAVAQCSPIENPLQSFVKCHDVFGAFHFNSSCQFQCGTGFKLEGPQRLRCLASGHWDNALPVCQGTDQYMLPQCCICWKIMYKYWYVHLRYWYVLFRGK